jgi:hypothetical protein
VARARSTKASIVLVGAALLYGALLVWLAEAADSVAIRLFALSAMALGGLTLAATGLLVPYVASIARQRRSGGRYRLDEPSPPIRWRDWLPLVVLGIALVTTAAIIVVTYVE